MHPFLAAVTSARAVRRVRSMPGTPRALAIGLSIALAATLPMAQADTADVGQSTGGSRASSAAAPSPGVKTLATVRVTAPIPKDSDSATKTDTPIVDIPQSVSVVTAEEIRNRGLQGVEESMWYIAGAQGGGYGPDSRSDWLLVRGFPPARYLDGLALPAGSGTGITRIEPYGLQRVEVIKGPSSVLYGAMPPGGMLNMISKRPTEQPLHEVAMQVGSFNLRQGQFDFGGPLNRNGTLLYRLTGLARNSDTMVDYIKDDRYYLAPALTWKPSDATSLTVLSRFQRGETASGGGFLPAAGTLLPNPNGKISRHLFTGEPGQNDYDKTLASIGYEFRHAFGNGVHFNQNLRYGKADVDNNGANIGAFGLLADGRTLLRYAFPNENHTRTFGIDNNLQYGFDTGALQHTVLFGVDYRRTKDNYASAFSFNAPPLDVFDPVYGGPVNVPAYTSHALQVQKQLGVYAQDQVDIGRWGITVGGRRDHVDTATEQLIGGGHAQQTDRAFSGRIGINYQLDNGLVPYLSWSHSFQPTVGTDFGGHAFEPTTGDQYEAGLKFQPAGGNGLVTVAAYQIIQRNSLTIDPNHVLFQVQQGETRLRGAELEGRWNLGRSLSVYGDYTWSDSKVTHTNDLPSLDKQIPLLPRQQASLGFDYTLVAGPLAGFGFGGGVRYVGTHYGDIYNQWKTPSYTLVDATLHYDLPDWRLQLNTNNLFDREYVSVCNSAAWCYYGYARSVTFSARYHW